VKSEQDFASMQDDVAHLKAELMSVKQLMADSSDAVAGAPYVPDSVNNTLGSEAAGIAEVSQS